MSAFDIASPLTPGTVRGSVAQVPKREVVCVPLTDYQKLMMGQPHSQLSSVGSRSSMSTMASHEGGTGWQARPPHAMLCWVSDLASPQAREDLASHLRQMQDCSLEVVRSGSAGPTTPRHTNPPMLQFFSVYPSGGQFRCRRRRSRSCPSVSAAAVSGSSATQISPRTQRYKLALRQSSRPSEGARPKQYSFQPRVSFEDEPGKKGVLDEPILGGKDAGRRVHRYPTKVLQAEMKPPQPKVDDARYAGARRFSNPYTQSLAAHQTPTNSSTAGRAQQSSLISAGTSPSFVATSSSSTMITNTSGTPLVHLQESSPSPQHVDTVDSKEPQEAAAPHRSYVSPKPDRSQSDPPTQGSASLNDLCFGAQRSSFGSTALESTVIDLHADASRDTLSVSRSPALDARDSTAPNLPDQSDSILNVDTTTSVMSSTALIQPSEGEYSAVRLGHPEFADSGVTIAQSTLLLPDADPDSKTERPAPSALPPSADSSRAARPATPSIEGISRPTTPTGPSRRRPVDRARSCGVAALPKARGGLSGVIGGGGYSRRRLSKNWERDAISLAACGRYESESLLVLTDSDASLVELPQVLKALLPTNHVEVVLLASAWREDAYTLLHPPRGAASTAVVASYAPPRGFHWTGTPRAVDGRPGAWPRQVGPSKTRSPALPPSTHPSVAPAAPAASRQSPTQSGNLTAASIMQRRNSSVTSEGVVALDRKSSMYRVSGKASGALVTTEFEQVWECERWYPITGWRSPVLPGDPAKFDRKMNQVELPPGWSWSTEWYIAGDDAGWEYSGRFGRHWTRGRSTPKAFSFARRRRWLRHRDKRTTDRAGTPLMASGSAHGQEFSVGVSSSPLFSMSIASMMEDFFPSGAGGTHVPAAELGAFTKVRNAMKEALVKPVLHRGLSRNRRADTFTGKEALEWMFREGLGYLPTAALPQITTPRTPRTPRQRKGRDREKDATMDRRRDPRFILESMRLQGILACADHTRAPALFRGDDTVYYVQEESTDATSLFEQVLATLSPQLHMLSDLSFDTSSSWFRGISQSVAQSNKITDDFASQHRHRWKSKCHQCYHCSDRLVEDAVVKLFCGHTLCYECVKVHLRHQSEYCRNNGIGDYEAVVQNLVICKQCHTPSSVNISTSSVGLTQYDVDRAALFAYQVEEVYENQRRRIGGKFKKDHLFAADRSAYSDAAGKVTSPTAHDITLPGPEWQWAEHWQKQKAVNTDSSGWQYAFSWGHNDWRDPHWKSHPTGLTFVRRRLLRRLRINGPGTMFLREQMKKEMHRRYGPRPSADTGGPYFLRASLNSSVAGD
eukprot:TRINITY_DN14243_c0_g2_i1.p1 TRINITY_DN14243_c0_g2~~TRINITY_DN14243_c0_g2_i1.p1  ORF type:complete len:1305 (+),score=198.62 TRINITY_DN14243_c0_g2_i1:118-4032(+)